MSVAFINNHGEKGYNHDVNHDETKMHELQGYNVNHDETKMHELQGYNVNDDETKMHELHQTYGTLLSEEQNLKIRVTIHQILAASHLLSVSSWKFQLGSLHQK